ncbi:MAG: tyrosine-type recombinase/integrase [Propionibacteriaceae bacterium]|nr:tyrosine-type recombinase/integrase [Propionibacteriaceae bacterium]
MTAQDRDARSWTLGRAVDAYLDEVAAQAARGDLSDNTHAAYAADLRELADILGEGTPLGGITGPDLDDAITRHRATPDRRHTRAPAPAAPKAADSVERFRASVRRFFTRAAVLGWIGRSPVEDMAARRRPAKPALSEHRRALTRAQTRALLDHGAGDPSPDSPAHNPLYARDRFVLHALAVLGVRVSPLCAANISDIDSPAANQGSAATWRFVTKGRKAMSLPVPAPLAELRDAYLATRPGAAGDDPLIATRNGNRATPRDIERILDRAHQRVLAADPSNARALTPHALRHTAATLMLADGWDVKIVKGLLGHSNLATTSKYLDEIPGELEAAVRDHSAKLAHGNLGNQT